MNDTANRNWSGETIVSFEALKTPARPAVVAPMAKARSFVVTVLTPLAAAASSSSRIAFQARPVRESCIRYNRIIATVTIPTMTMKYAKGVRGVNSPMSGSGSGRKIPLIPFVPSVHFSRLRNTIGTISPKPRVMIAR